jgi:hypothetical protein
VKPPNLEELLSESEAAHALTVNSTAWNALLAQLLSLNGNAIGAKELLLLCQRSVPPSDTRTEDGESLMGHLAGLYVERYGEPYSAEAIWAKGGDVPLDCYYALHSLMELVTELRGDL